MVTVAILDDGVSESLTGKKLGNSIKISSELSLTVDTENKVLNHATECALIFYKYASQDVVLYSVKIIQDHSGSATQLSSGIRWCYRNGIRLVFFSLGSVNFCDAALLQNCINDYANRGMIFICATANSNAITYPAVFSNTISVKTLPEKTFPEDHFICGGTNWYGVDFIANSVHTVQICTISPYTYQTKRCNSMSAPLIAGRVQRILERSPLLTITQVKQVLGHEAYGEKIINATVPDFIHKAIVIGSQKIVPIKRPYFSMDSIDGFSVSRLVHDVIQSADTVIFYTKGRDRENVLADINKLKNCEKHIICLHSCLYIKPEDYLDIQYPYKIWCPDLRREKTVVRYDLGFSIEEPVIQINAANFEFPDIVFTTLKELFIEKGYHPFILYDHCCAALAGLYPCYSTEFIESKCSLIQFIRSMNKIYQYDLVIVGNIVGDMASVVTNVADITITLTRQSETQYFAKIFYEGKYAEIELDSIQDLYYMVVRLL